MGPERNRHLLILPKDIFSSLYYIYYKSHEWVEKKKLSGPTSPSDYSQHYVAPKCTP